MIKLLNIYYYIEYLSEDCLNVEIRDASYLDGVSKNIKQKGVVRSNKYSKMLAPSNNASICFI